MSAMRTPADETAASRRTYGRGMFDGLRMAGVDNPEEFVNAAKLERIESSLNGIARKVLDAVPLAEAWSTGQIIGEMARTTGSNPDFRIVQGCLSKMVDQGLVRESAPGRFERVKVRPTLAAVNATATESEPADASAPHPAADPQPTRSEGPVDPLDKLATLGASLREASERLAAFAREVEDVALSVEERIQRIHADTEKLRQLQSLLKDFSK